MPVVPHSQIRRVHAAAVAAGLIATRNELLAGLPQSLVAPFPTAANASACTKRSTASAIPDMTHKARKRRAAPACAKPADASAAAPPHPAGRPSQK